LVGSPKASFRQRVQAIVEAFTCMQDDLSAEKKAFHKQWAKREIQLERLMRRALPAIVTVSGDV
jgi:hypothetical protein